MVLIFIEGVLSGEMEFRLGGILGIPVWIDQNRTIVRGYCGEIGRRRREAFRGPNCV